MTESLRDSMNCTRAWLTASLLMLFAFGAVTIMTQIVKATPSSQDEVVNYLDQIAQRVEQQPGYQQLVSIATAKKSARQKHLRTLVTITVTTGGRLRDATVNLSSGDRAFDQSALALVRRAQPFGELPPVLTKRGQLVFVLPVPLP